MRPFASRCGFPLSGSRQTTTTPRRAPRPGYLATGHAGRRQIRDPAGARRRAAWASSTSRATSTPDLDGRRQAVRAELAHRPDVPRANARRGARARADRSPERRAPQRGRRRGRRASTSSCSTSTASASTRMIERHAHERTPMPLERGARDLPQIARGRRRRARRGRDPPRSQAGERPPPQEGRRREGHRLRHRQGRGRRQGRARA